jgi:TRAP-type mannitol/chloroaromatic compound transport system permease large subunit
MVTGVIQAGSSLGILIPPSVVLVLYGMIARQPMGQLWLAGVFPGLLLASLFIGYIVHPLLPAAAPRAGCCRPRSANRSAGAKSCALLRAGIVPLVIFFSMTGLFLMG